MGKDKRATSKKVKKCQCIVNGKAADCEEKVVECPHLHFKSDVVLREKLTKEQHLDLLCTPKGYRWDGDEAKKEGEPGEAGAKKPPDGPKPPKKITCQGKRIKKPERSYVHNFLAEIWTLLTPEMLKRLKTMLQNEFKMTPEEAEEFIDKQRETNIERSTTVSQYKKPRKLKDGTFVYDTYADMRKPNKSHCDKYPQTTVGIRNDWVLKLADVVAGKFSSYVVETTCIERTERQKEIAKTLFDRFNGLLELDASMEKPKTRTHKAMAVVADRLSLWLDKNVKMSDEAAERLKKLEAEKLKEKQKKEEAAKEPPPPADKVLMTEPTMADVPPERGEKGDSGEHEEAKEASPEMDVSQVPAEESPKEVSPEKPPPEEGEGVPAEAETGGKAEPEEVAPVEEEAKPAEEEVVPAEEEPAPAAEEAAPAEGEAAPAEGETAPTEGEAAPAEEEPAPAEQEAVPTEEGTAAAGEEAVPAEEEATPTEEEAAPATDEAAPAEEGVAPTEEEAAAAEEEAEPAGEGAEPTGEEATEPEPQETPVEEEPVSTEPSEPTPTEDVPDEEVTEKALEEEPEDSEVESEPPKASDEEPVEAEPQQPKADDLLKKVASMISDTEEIPTSRQEMVKDMLEKKLEKMASGQDIDAIRDVAGKVGTWMDQVVDQAEKEYGVRDRAGSRPPVSQKGKGPVYKLRKTPGEGFNVERITHTAASQATRRTRGFSESPNKGQSLSPQEAKNWAKWAGEVSKTAVDWAEWIENTVQEAQSRNKDTDPTGNDWRDKKSVDAQQWRQTKKQIDQQAAAWLEKTSHDPKNT